MNATVGHISLRTGVRGREMGDGKGVTGIIRTESETVVEKPHKWPPQMA